jgi:hypothetical protein
LLTQNSEHLIAEFDLHALEHPGGDHTAAGLEIHDVMVELSVRVALKHENSAGRVLWVEFYPAGMASELQPGCEGE